MKFPKAMPRSWYGDPSLVLEQRQAARGGCVGCSNLKVLEITGESKDVCLLGKKIGRRCQAYEVRR